MSEQRSRFSPGFPGVLLGLAVALPFLISAWTMEARAPYAIHGNDGFLNYAYLRSMLVSGDLDFADDYLAFDDLNRYPYSMAQTPRDEHTLRAVNRYGWGSSLLWFPFTLQAHLISVAFPGIPANGLNPLYYLSIRVGSAFWGLLGLALLIRVARRRLFPASEPPGDEMMTRHLVMAVIAMLVLVPALWGILLSYLSGHRTFPYVALAVQLMVIPLAIWMAIRRTSSEASQEACASHRLTLWTAVAMLAATNLGFYLFLHPSMSTAPAFGLAGLIIWLIDRISDKPSSGNWFGLGMAWALLGCARYGDVGFLIGLIPAIVFAGLLGKKKERVLRTPTAIPALIAGIAPVAICQMAIWWYLYGTPFAGPTPYLGDEYGWAIPGRHSLAVLLSFHHGWIVWHPIVFFGLIGVVMISLDKEQPPWLRLLPLAILGQLLIVGAWSEWTGGASFGGRLMATALSVVFLGLVVFFRWLSVKWGRLWPPIIIIVLSLWNLCYLALYAAGRIPRQGAVSPLDVLSHLWDWGKNLYH